ncbi:MAG: GH25 family lysozyme [Saprospiraceae bacterium]|nr:GH25 family lysozyme [Saprospiraceae bacterium]
MKSLLFTLIGSVLILSCQNQPNPTESTNKTQSEATSTAVDTNLSTEKAATKTTTDKEQLEGIDVSHYQTTIDWGKAKESNVSFVFIKATGGESYIDPTFTNHWKNAKDANLKRGAYHFYYTKDDPIKQANFFVETVLPLSEKNDLPPVIDIESGGVNSNISDDQLQKDVVTFLTIIEEKFKRKPILYSSHAFAQKHFTNREFSKYYLWLAEYDSKQPRIPEVWKSTGWTFWQNSASTNIEGYTGKVDHDIFNGNMEAINNL